MKLKTLEVQGFKTFPDKTKLNFTDGITAVVGPNGSGKSNISDAIRWVLGEQSAKALRCSRMEDVIFNGTQQRKKTGYAQVTLSFDNSDRTLKFDGDEVAVTRRYYRSGNSEYLINNTAVRLQDIHELFMDTGLGRDGYSMIGQGKIDSIVATKGEDRREIFEEAAGISRFRYKKAEAERRLDRTEDDLVRLRDILSELEGRVGPLKVQSEKAKAYLVYAEEKRGLEIALWLRNLERSAAAVREQEDKLTVANMQYNDTVAALERIQKETEENYSKQNECIAETEKLRKLISEKEDLASQCRSQAALLKSDIKHKEETASRIQGEIDIYSKTGQELTDEIKSKKDTIKKLESKLSEQKSEQQRLTDELLKLRSGESESADKLAAINASLAELNSDAGDAKIEFMTSSSSISELTERMEVVENTIKARRSQIDTLNGIIDDYSVMCTDCDDNIRKITEEKSEIEKKITEQEKVCAEIKSQAEKTDLRSQELYSKARMLEELEKNLEGFAHSVKTIMREAKKGMLSGIHGPVSRVIQTSSEYSIAIEIALGAAMQNIVTTDDSDAKRAIAYLKQHDGGRATFLPMSTIKGRELNETGLESCRGFVGIAADLCSCDDCYRGILLNLLGRIVVAEDLDRAVEIAKKYSYRFRIVTLDGQVVNAGGSLTGGSLSKNTGLLGRTEEIKKMRSDAEQISGKADKLFEKYDKCCEMLKSLEDEKDNISAELSTVQGDKVKLEAEIKSRRSELEATKKSLEEIQKERKDSVRKLEEMTETMESARKRMDVFRKKISENEEEAKRITGSKDELVKKRESLGEELQNKRLDVVTLEKDISAVQAEIENAELRLTGSNEKIKNGQEEIRKIKEENKKTLSEIDDFEKKAARYTEEASGFNEDIQKKGSERLELEKRSGELRKDEREKTSEKEKISGELARLEERRVNLQKSYDDTEAKLWDEYELTKREAEKYAAEIEDAGKAQRRLSELKQKIKSLGNVNVSAIEEYKEVSERYEFMKVQLGDIEKSKSELLKLINDLTKQMREIFIIRFNEINKNFSETFVELFGGGKASLSLSDPENVLTTGIDISVEPPGKIVSHIELLSGGEKALVAIALYFAIMKVSPAPFCVMDEIEAALDDVNVYRFADYLRKMNENTQFICITHRRGTMEEADVLYGVTMQDRGISKLLELKAAEIEQKLNMKA